MKFRLVKRPVIHSVWLLLAVLLTGCVGPMVSVRSADKAPPEDRVTRFHIEFVDSDYRTIPRAIIRQPPQKGFEAFHKVLWLGLHAIPGRIAGIPQPSFFQQILKSEDAIGSSMEPGTQEDFAFSLSELESMLSKYAAAYRARPEDANFSVEPAETRFVRLTMTASSGPFSYINLHESGFIDGTTREHYVLVYVDRPCRIAGDIHPLDGLYQHQLIFKKAGLHWLRIQKSAEKTAKVTVSDPSEPVSVYVRYDRISPH